MSLREDADKIINAAIAAARPENAVVKALQQADFSSGRLVLIAAGKAAWQMADAAYRYFNQSVLSESRSLSGVVITKYGHSCGPIGNSSKNNSGDCAGKYSDDCNAKYSDDRNAKYSDDRNAKYSDDFPADLKIFEAGHPVPDENSFAATRVALDAVKNLTPADHVLFLLSGGGSALFESPLVSPEELADITRQLLSCGAEITEINTIRKRLSAVKGGRFARACAPAHVTSVVLSDVLGDPLDVIASGPAYPDSSTCDQALAIAEKYGLQLSEKAAGLLRQETEKFLDNVTTFITGSVRQLACSAEETCRALGYEPVVLTTELTCTARDAGVFLAGIGKEYSRRTVCAALMENAPRCAGIPDGGAENAVRCAGIPVGGAENAVRCAGIPVGKNVEHEKIRKYAFIAGGETVVKLTGKGLGGRNQELALAAAPIIAGLPNVAVFSVGSDGTDGPTDAAGGYVDGKTADILKQQDIDIFQVLQDNDSYHALEKCGGLIITGPTGTNVNDLSVVLVG